MRSALGSLTVRGRSFIGAGVAASFCGLVLGERILLQIGVLLLVLPIVAVVVVARTRYRLTATRETETARIPAGSTTSATLRIENVSRLPTGLLLVEEALPYQLGSAPRFVLDRVEPHGSRTTTYRLSSDTRGRYDIGPLTVRLADPFGMVELTRSFARIDRLVVTPTIHRLPDVSLTGDWTGGGDSHARTVAAAGDDDVATREYRRGDDLRRVHWKTTAKRGELMVRREEQHWQSRCTILLDTRHRAYHGGQGPGSAFEHAVSAAASIGVDMVGNGFGLRMVTDTGTPLAGFGDLTGASLEAILLEELAIVHPSKQMHLVDAHTRNLLAGGSEGLLVAVVGSLDDTDLDELTRLRHAGGTGVAVAYETATWASKEPTARDHERYTAVLDRLRGAGWRVVPMRRQTRLADAWRQVDAGHLSTGRAS